MHRCMLPHLSVNPRYGAKLLMCTDLRYRALFEYDDLLSRYDGR